MSIPFILNKIESYSNEVSNEAKEELQTLFNASKSNQPKTIFIDFVSVRKKKYFLLCD
jgi:SpoVK/Ycf46/Vps4 family AAA+-type ATPase